MNRVKLRGYFIFKHLTLEMKKIPRQETYKHFPTSLQWSLPSCFKSPQGSIATRHWNSLPCGLFHYILCSLACHDGWQRLGWWKHKRWDEKGQQESQAIQKAKHECKNTDLLVYLYDFIRIYYMTDYMYSCWYKILINLETRPIWYPGVWFGFKYSKKNVLDKHMFFNVNAVLDWLNG